MLYRPVGVPEEIEERRTFLTNLRERHVMVQRDSGNDYEMGILNYDEESGEFHLVGINKIPIDPEKVTGLLIRI